jgi:hypothetical protein
VIMAIIREIYIFSFERQCNILPPIRTILVFSPDLVLLPQARVGFNKSQSRASPTLQLRPVSKCRWTGFDYRSRPDLLLTFIVEKLLFFNVLVRNLTLYLLLSRPDQ